MFSNYEITKTDKSLDLEFAFEVPGLAEFKPRWSIAAPSSFCRGLDDERLNTLVFSLGMVELVSYWKATCSPNVHINCGSLSEEQIRWWKKLYKNGLGEFFHINGIAVDDGFISINAVETQRNTANEARNRGSKIKALVPIGGGKDSAVTLELLKGHAERFCFVINPGKAALDTVSASHVDDGHVIIANRTLDDRMLALNRQGFLNGHTPFSALVAFSSVLTAYVYGIEYVVLSNETSANEPTIIDSGVNHQYSKSLEFESDFIDYEARYLSSGVKYFSLLRPFTEAGIVKIFSRLERYHKVFRSCNEGGKENIWCAKCPKCLFVYIILSPFLPKNKMVDIFGTDILDNPELIPVLDKLIGVEPEKPFECVGSYNEVNAALQEIMRRHELDNTALPETVKYYKQLGIAEKYDFSSVCNSYDENNHIPDEFAYIVKNKLKEFDDD